MKRSETRLNLKRWFLTACIGVCLGAFVGCSSETCYTCTSVVGNTQDICDKDEATADAAKSALEKGGAICQKK